MLKLLYEKAAKVLNLVRMNLSGVKTCFSCDGDNNRGIHHMIKCISFYVFTNEHLVTYELDIDGCVGTNEKFSAAIDISMKKLDPPRPSEPKLIVNDLSEDAGGGRTGV